MANIIERWDLIKLENLLDFYIGGDWGEQEPINSNYIATKVLRATDISNWENDHGENAQIRYLKDNSLAKRQLKENDLIIEVSGGSPDQPVGRTIIISSDDIQKFQYPITCSNFFRLLRFNNKINPKFINYYFKFLYETKIIESYQSNSTNLRNLKFSQFINQNIPVPQTLEEQQEIVDVLDAASEIIRLRTACIESAQSLIPALFQEMFGDPINNTKNYPCESLKKLCSKIGSGATPRGGKESYLKEGISFVRSMNVHDGIFQYKDLAFINDEQAKLLDNVELQESDVLINITGASVARTCIVPKEILPARVNQHVSILRCTGRLNPYFLNVLLYFQTTKQKLLDLANSKGATREAITKQQLELFKIILPPIEQQELFAEKVQEIEAYIKTQHEELENAKTMFQSLLHYAFTGELTRRAYGE